MEIKADHTFNDSFQLWKGMYYLDRVLLETFFVKIHLTSIKSYYTSPPSAA